MGQAYHADSTDLNDKEILTWDTFGTSAREMAQTIADSDYDPEIVIAIARGGLLPAGALAYALGLKLSDAINVEFYTDVHETLPDPILLAPMLDIDAIRGQEAARRRRRRRFRAHPRARPRAAEEARRRSSVRSDLRKVGIHHRPGLRVEAHGSVDRLPMVGRATGRRLQIGCRR